EGGGRRHRGRRSGRRSRPRRDREARVSVRRRHPGPPRGAAHRPGHEEDRMRPGEILFAEGSITLHAGRPTAEVTATNTSDHTIFISSHFPFFEVNPRLVFDRALAWGMHLDVPAGDSVRWRPAETRTVRLGASGRRRPGAG